MDRIETGNKTERDGDEGTMGEDEQVRQQAIESAKGLRLGERIHADRKRRTAQFVMAQDHYHRFYELFYMISGRCRIFLNHTIYHMEAGDLLLIEPLALHHMVYSIAQESERIAVNFAGDFLESMKEQCGGQWLEQLRVRPVLSVEAGRRGYVENLLQKLMLEEQGTDAFTEMLRQNYLYELMAFLGRCGAERKAPGHLDAATIQLQEKEVQEAARYIYTHFQEPLTLECVAQRVHMSPTYFSRRFKHLTGFGYKEYLNDVRLNAAARLLLETDLSVTEIARRCGYTDGNYFGDLFKKEKGISPRMYRKNPQIV